MTRGVSNFQINNLFRRLSKTNGDLRLSNSIVAPAVVSNSVWSANFKLTPNIVSVTSSYCHLHQFREMATQAEAKKTNRLVLEKSPYLLQHSTNPVDWYPWGQEAFDKAKAENKLIFLSVGYSTCHWCHVMEKESFENESVAEIMNKHFVNIKVDREERPDVDRLYMSFVQATAGSGGWPMSVFLSPDLEPLAGGTYFPPEDMYGRPGFKSVLKDLAKQWNTNRSKMEAAAKKIIGILRNMEVKETKDGQSIPGEDAWKTCVLQLTRNYESDYGGFSTAPKFPQPTNFNFLFHMYSRNKHSEQGYACLEMCLHTLKKMAYGGIHDHVNKGFARYSVDAKWHVPHFEKMLYDQAQLVVSYCDAYLLTKEEFYADVVRDILTYVSRDLSHPLGGFYGAEDADSYPYEGAAHKQEGAFCVWEYDEIFNLLNEKTDNISHAELIEYHYNVKKEGNVRPSQDPHGELTKKNVLACFGSYESTASKFGTTVEKVKEILEKCHEILYVERQKRPKPHVDTKILTSWNGLMISGYARAGFALKDQAYIDRAIKATSFIKKYLYDEKEKNLLRCCYKDESGGITLGNMPIAGFIDDYAFLIRGLLDLYEASLDTEWLQWAETLQETQDNKFWDSKNSGYFTSADDDASILVRGKEVQDGAEPSGNSVSVHNLLRLSVYLHRQDLHQKAEKILKGFSDMLERVPIALPEMTSALLFYHNSPTQVFIAGAKEDTNTQALLDVLRSRFIPGRILAVADGPTGAAGLLYRRHEHLSHMRPVGGKPAAYVCRNFACALPLTEPAELATSLDSGNGNSHKKCDGEKESQGNRSSDGTK
ncbi:spermatogenesis-associated protein 20 [Diabrotica undecimpunctata]|uniref:spermatogenesis-associated protein 20 n=1 Tax=Diabrotica undecimpunctata TaxID=50387 RepID=UPI003B6336F8